MHASDAGGPRTAGAAADSERQAMSMDRRDFMKHCAGAAAFGAAALYGWPARAAEQPVELDESFVYHCPDLVEITEPTPIVMPDGSCRCAWTRKPYMQLNFEDAQFASPTKMRKALKKWDMYHFYTPTHAFHFLMSWIPYAAFFTLLVHDRRTGVNCENAHFIPPKPMNEMMRDSTAGRSVYESDIVNAVFEVQGERRRITVDFTGFNKDDKSDLGADFDLYLPADHDSIAGAHVAAPGRPYYGHKINCMTASGRLTANNETIELNPEDSFAALDFGRGYYPRKLFWYWATASGRHDDGKLLGFNLGYGNRPDNSTENALFYDGVITKVGPVECTASPDDRAMEPWTVHDAAGLVDLVYTPTDVRPLNVTIGNSYNRGRTCLGNFSGNMTTAAGKSISVKDLFGVFEWVNSKW